MLWRDPWRFCQPRAAAGGAWQASGIEAFEGRVLGNQRQGLGTKVGSHTHAPPPPDDRMAGAAALKPAHAHVADGQKAGPGAVPQAASVVRV